MKLNLPCRITVSRILLVPIIIALYLIPAPAGASVNWFKFAATMVFAIAAITDMEGMIARKRNMVTDLGKLLDTSADKFLVTAGLLLIFTDITTRSFVFGGSVLMPAWLAVTIGMLIIGRDFIVMALRGLAGSKGIVIAADMAGKVKQVFQVVAIPMYMGFASGATQAMAGKSFGLAFEIICLSLLAISALLSLYSGIHYLVKNRKVIS